MTQEKASVNEGIQANSVTVDVLAVGRGARAVKTMNTISSAELADTLNHLRVALNGLNIDDAARRAVKEDLNRLEMATRKKQPDKDEVGGILKSIAKRLKAVGVVLSEVTSLSEAISKIAGIVGLALKSIF